MALSMTLPTGCSSTKVNDAFTIAVMGDSRVGKSTTICRILKHWYELANQLPKKRKRSVDDLGVKGRDLTVEVIDTKSRKWIASLGLPNCHAFLLVYSLVNDKSFHSACAVREKILQLKGPDVPIVFVANKRDIADTADMTERVSRDKTIRGEWGHGHTEISAEYDISTRQILEEVMRQYKKCADLKDGIPKSPILVKLRDIKKQLMKKNSL